MENDISKLPKWAQDEINELRQALASTHEQGKTEVSVTEFTGKGTTRRWLPQGSVIRFQLSDNDDNYIECRVRHNKLFVMGIKTIVIYPDASNVVRVGTVLSVPANFEC